MATNSFVGLAIDNGEVPHPLLLHRHFSGPEHRYLLRRVGCAHRHCAQLDANERKHEASCFDQAESRERRKACNQLTGGRYSHRLAPIALAVRKRVPRARVEISAGGGRLVRSGGDALPLGGGGALGHGGAPLVRRTRLEEVVRQFVQPAGAMARWRDGGR
eukprot:4487407-Pleurochrysis_carterae.AAC.1